MTINSFINITNGCPIKYHRFKKLELELGPSTNNLIFKVSVKVIKSNFSENAPIMAVEEFQIKMPFRHN